MTTGPDETAKNGGGKRKKILIVCMAVAVLLILSTGITLYMVSKTLFSAEKFAKPSIAQLNTQLQMQAQVKLVNLVVTCQNAKEEEPDAVASLELTGKEIDALMTDILGHNSPLLPSIEQRLQEKKFPLRAEDMWFALADDHFILQFAKDTGIWTPGGSIVNCQIDYRLEIRDGKGEFRILEAKAGTLTQLTGYINRKFGTNWDLFRKSEQYRMMLELVDTLEVKDGTLILKYRPYKIKRLVAPWLGLLFPNQPQADNPSAENKN